jgi:hypothetical protein
MAKTDTVAITPAIAGQLAVDSLSRCAAAAIIPPDRAYLRGQRFSGASCSSQ